MVYLYIYVALLAGLRIAEAWALRSTASPDRKPVREWTVLLIAVPYFATIIGAPVEHLLRQTAPSAWLVALGVTLFVAGVALRVRGHLDLRESFSIAIEKLDQHELVMTGVYSKIRHPLYLGNLLTILACPVILGCTLAWVPAGLLLIGIVWRIRLEERFLRAEFGDYGEYAERTSALIPGVF